MLLALTLSIVSCNPYNKNNKIEPSQNTSADTIIVFQTKEIVSNDYIDGIPKTVKQNLFETKILLSKLTDPYDLHLYGKIEFIIDNKIALEYKEKYLEIEGYQDNVCTFFQQQENGGFVSFYVFRYNNRPSPDKFLVFKQIGNEIKFIGTTEQSTADVFGDIDLDGKFEIGGFNTNCEPGTKENDQPSHPLFCIDHLRVYEIGDIFIRDTIVERFIKNNKNVW